MENNTFNKIEVKFDYDFGNNYGLIDITDNFNINKYYNYQFKEPQIEYKIKLEENNLDNQLQNYNFTSTTLITCLLTFIIFMI